MTTYTFQKVSLYPSKTGKCVVCGKPAKRSKEFYQTLNPFNRNKDGGVKTREEIRAEVSESVKAWQQEPVLHAKCEPSTGTQNATAREEGKP